MRKILHQRRGQIGETLTWMVATLAIGLIVFASVAVASIFAGKTTLLGQNSVKVFTETNSIDLFAKESLVSFLLTKDSSGVPVYQQIIQENSPSASGGFNDFDGKLAANIFQTFYGSYYDYVVLGIIDLTKSNCPMPNTYFTPPLAGAMCSSSKASTKHEVNYIFPLSDTKEIKMYLWKL